MNIKALLLATVFLSWTALAASAEQTNRYTNTELAVDINVDGVTNTTSTNFSSTAKSNKEWLGDILTNFDRSVRENSNSQSAKRASATHFLRDQIMTNASPAALEISQAADLLAELKKQGKLPGVTKETRGRAIMNQTVTVDGPPGTAAPPQGDMTFDFIKTGDTLTNHYTIGRSSPDAELQLLKAWRTDMHGITITNWPVK